MHEMVRETVEGTMRLLFGLIANPEAVDKFADFFNKIRQRRFMMTVNDGKYQNKQFGTIVTITVCDDEGKFELLQGFLPVAVEMYVKTGKCFFTDFFEPEFGSVLQVLTDY